MGRRENSRKKSAERIVLIFILLAWRKGAFAGTRFANNEHLLCSLLAKQLILVRDWLGATVQFVFSDQKCTVEIAATEAF